MAERHPLQKPFTDVQGRRRVRSFVLRQGRLTSGQQRAMDEHWARFGIDFSGTPRALDSLFGRDAPVVIEIGFGNGEQLLFSCEQEPEKNFIGIEVHAPGVGRLLAAAAAQDAKHLRVYCHDAVEVLSHEIQDRSVDEIRIYFPDPWHKKRHQKRRLLQPPFVALLARKLKAGGLLHLATDWADYARQMIEVCTACPDLQRQPDAAVPAGRPHWRRQTHFETRGLNLGHEVCDLLFDRRR